MSAPLRRLAVEIYKQGLENTTPEILLRRALSVQGATLSLNFLDRRETVALDPQGGVFVLAVGKAAAPMALEAARLLGDRVSGGLIVTKEGFSQPGLPFPVHEAGHPVPDQRGLAAALAVEKRIGELGPGELLLVLVSGGASALLPAPIEGVSLADKQALADAMLRSEMDIHQINRVRKTLSRFKGGGLARLAAPARVVGLYLSDVSGDDPGVIGSGPTVLEQIDIPGAIGHLQNHGIWEHAPPRVREALRRAAPPPPLPPVVPINGVIGANRHLLQAMRAAAEDTGLLALVEENLVTGSNQDARSHLLARWEARRGQYPQEALCLMAGGETVVKVTGTGQGGRCQELAAMMMPRLEPGTVFLAAGSDGNDGPTDAAGGVVDLESWAGISQEGTLYTDLLANNDTYRLLGSTGNLIRVAPTRNNLMDVYLFLRESSDSPLAPP